jgi:hypothetical protein
MLATAQKRPPWFKQPPNLPGRPGSGSRPENLPQTAVPADEQPIVCRSCLFPITRPDQRMVMQGAHEHTFANPHGIVFQIGCFRSADGCGYLGAPTDEFTWFAGFQWRIALCANCLVNVGWLFTSPGGTRFHGLILDRLLFPD